MSAKLRAAGLMWPTAMTLVALPMLIGLGTWQMQRKAWKEDLIARVKSSAAEAPISLAELLTSSDGGNIEFRRVTVAGQLQHGGELHVWVPGPSGSRWSVVTPLVLAAPIGPDRRYPTQQVLVIRGVVDDAHKAPDLRLAGQVSGRIEITGRIRLGSSSLFSATPDMARNQWFAYDLQAMRANLVARAVDGSASGTVEKAMPLVAPAFVEAEASFGPPPAPQPRLDALNLSNRHLSYALTWYGLALTLIGVYLAFVRARARVLNGN